MRCREPFLVAFAFGLVAPRALADTGESESGYDPGPAKRRSDFAFGLLLGGAFGAVSGYPNQLVKIDVPRYEARTGLAGGPGGSAWVGGALRDWFTFGVGGAWSGVSGSGLTSNGLAFIAHVEAFPLFARGGTWQDLGVYGEFGAGSRGIRRGSDLVADGGSLSLVSLGVVHESLRLGPLSLGPAVQVSHQFSQSLGATLAVVGLRTTVYGGPG